MDEKAGRAALGEGGGAGRGAEDAFDDVTAKLAMLTMFAWTSSVADLGGTNPQLEKDCWRGIENLLLSIRKDVDTINAAAENGRAR